MAKNSFFSFLTQMSVVIGRSLVVVLIARIGGAELQGLYALSFLTIAALASVVTFGFDVANTYLLASRSKADSDGQAVAVYFTGTVLVTLLLTSFVIVLYLGVGEIFAGMMGLPVAIIGVIIVGLPIYGMGVSITGMARGVSDFKAIFFSEVAKQLVFIVLLLFASIQDALDIRWIVISWLLATAVNVSILWFALGHPLPVSFSFEAIKEQAVFGRWRFLQYMTLFLYMRLDLLLITAFLGVREAGYYATAKFIVDSFRRVPGVFLAPLTVNVAQHGPQHRSTSYVYRLTLILGIGFIIGVLLTAHLVVPLIFGEEFRSSVQPLYVLVFAGVIQALVELTSHRLYGLGHSFAPFITVVTAIVVIAGLGILLIPALALSGAALATLAGNTIALLILLKYLSQETHLSMLSLLRKWIPQREDIPLLVSFARRVSLKWKGGFSQIF